MPDYPVPVNHIKERTLVARVGSDLWHMNPGLVLVEVLDVYTYAGRRMASVDALPIAEGRHRPNVFRWLWGGGQPNANVPVFTLHDLAIVENGEVVEWLGELPANEPEEIPVSWPVDQILEREA